MMTFAALSTVFVLGVALLAAAAVFVMHLLRQTPRPILVSNLELWQRAMAKTNPRLLAARTIPWLALLLALLVSTLLVLLLGDPRFDHGVRGTTILIVPTGTSMGAATSGGSRLEIARARAREWAERGTAHGEVAIIAAGVRPRFVTPLTESLPDLERGLRALEIENGTSSVDAAIRLADELLRDVQGGKRDGRIVVFAEEPLTTASTAHGGKVIVDAVSRVANTIAITSFTARRDPAAIGEYLLHCEVASFAGSPARARLVIKDRHTTVADREISLAPGARENVVVRGYGRAQAEIEARIVRVLGVTDELADDNAVFATVAPLRAIRVAYASSAPSRALQVALASTELLVAKEISAGEVSSLSPSDTDVLIVDGTVPVPNGLKVGVLGLGASGVALANSIGAVSTRADVRGAITASTTTHAALERISLDGVSLERATAFDTDRQVSVLARAGSDAVIVAEDATAHGRRIAVGFDLRDSDWPRRASFPLFVFTAARWLARHDAADVVLSRTPGQALAATSSSVVVAPDGTRLSTHGGVALGTTSAGIYHVDKDAVAYSGERAHRALSKIATPWSQVRSYPLPPLALLIGLAVVLFIVIEWGLLARGVVR